MALMLPPEASKLLNELGFEWPEGNEDTIFTNGGRWIDYGSSVMGSYQDANAAARSVTAANRSEGIDAFTQDFNKSEGVADVSKNLGIAGQVMGGILYLIGAAVITLKIVFIVNLVSTLIQIATAIAAAVPSAGTSLAWIPVAKLLCQKALEMGINLAVSKLMGA